MALRLPGSVAGRGKIISFKLLQAVREFRIEFYNYIILELLKVQLDQNMEHVCTYS
jgi:hypothetical protein